MRQQALYRVALASALFCVVALCRASEPGDYTLTAWDAPSAVEPGQRVQVTASLQVKTAGAKSPAQPRFWLVPKSAADSAFSVPERQITPWEWPAERAAGDIVRVTATIDVPEDMRPGPAEFQFRIAVAGEPAQLARIADAQGHDLGDCVRRDVIVTEAAASTTRPSDVPLLVHRMNAPTLDGALAPGEWSQATAIARFIENSGRTPPAAQTSAYVGYDEQNLYIAFNCDEPLMAKAVRTPINGRDGSVWDNEAVEVFLNPTGDLAGYMHFIADIANQKYDAIGEDAWGFNPAWRSAVHEGPAGWSVEMALPFASLGIAPPASGQMWRANLCRERKAQSELSAWRPARGSFASPGTFGVWVFGSLTDYLLARANDLSPPANGWPGGVEEQAKVLDGDIGSWRALAKSSADQPDANYTQLASGLDSLRQRHGRLLLAAARASGERFTVSRAWPYQSFDGAPSRLDRPIEPIAMDLMRDEWVDLAFNITNNSDQPLVLRCTAHPVEKPEPSDYLKLGIPGLKTQWQNLTPVGAADGRVVFDALVPNVAGIVRVASGSTEQVWLSIHAPDDATGSTSGCLRIEPIDMGGGQPFVAPLRIHIIPTRLTENPPLHCFTWNFAGELESQPDWWRAHLQDLAAHGVDTCMVSSLNHLPRVQAQPDGTMPQTLDFAKLDRLLNATKGLFRLYWINMDIFEKATIRTDLIGLEFATPQYERAFKQWLGQLVTHLSQQGVGFDRFMINPYDESVDERCRLLARWIKEVNPEIRIVIDSSTPDMALARKMDAVTDVWVPHYRQFFPPEMQAFHELLKAGGKPRWMYWYAEGTTEKTQDPSRYYLSKFWWAFHNEIAGIGYWAQQYYGDPWRRQDWQKSYDTALWYPVDGGVLPSRRWQAWRRGWQDFLLLSLTRDELRRRDDPARLAQLDELVKQAVAFPGDPVRTDRARQWAKSVLSESASGRSR